MDRLVAGLTLLLVVDLLRGGGGVARRTGAGEYYAGFLIEKSLSIDNVFVWTVISFFAVPRAYQSRVLF